jgi:hypothetical protein
VNQSVLFVAVTLIWIENIYKVFVYERNTVLGYLRFWISEGGAVKKLSKQKILNQSTPYPDARNFAMTWRQFNILLWFSGFCRLLKWMSGDFLLLMHVNEWMPYEVQMRVHQWTYCMLRTFITYLLVHMHQKTKIALDIAAEIASINGPL